MYLSHIHLRDIRERYSTVLIFGTSRSRRDAEITEHTRSEPSLIGEVGAAWSGGRSPSSPVPGVMRQREIPPRSVPRWPLCVPFCCRPLGATAAWFATVFLYLRRVENRGSETIRTIARISLRISFPFFSPFSSGSLSFFLRYFFIRSISIIMSVFFLLIFDSGAQSFSLSSLVSFGFSPFSRETTAAWISNCRYDNPRVFTRRWIAPRYALRGLKFFKDWNIFPSSRLYI